MIVMIVGLVLFMVGTALLPLSVQIPGIILMLLGTPLIIIGEVSVMHKIGRNLDNRIDERCGKN